MIRRVSTLFTFCALLAVAPQAALADSTSALFGVGLTVLPLKGQAPAGVIYRNAVYTPGAVAVSLAAQGYSQVALVGRTDASYVFSAVSRSSGQRYLLTVAAWKGQIVSAVRG